MGSGDGVVTRRRIRRRGDESDSDRACARDGTFYILGASTLARPILVDPSHLRRRAETRALDGNPLQTLIVCIITRRRATIDATARRAGGHGGEKTTCVTRVTRPIDMADDERATVEDDGVDFDPTLKKKKSKKVTLDLSDDESAVNAAAEGVDDMTLDAGDGEFGKKKKKKKKDKALALDDDGEDSGDVDLDAEFGSKKKKKSSKKKKAIEAEDGIDDAADADADEGRDGTHTGSGTSWDGTTRDYHYDELLGRVFGILREKNPALGEKAKTIIKPPQVLREGTKKTVFANLMEICNAMHRPSEHVTQYLLAELGTSGTLDGQQRLVLKGRFLPKVFEGVLRHYFIDYVICNMCKSSDTQLVKEQASRLSYCRCQACGASRSVGAIQRGFAALGKGERRKARQATG